MSRFLARALATVRAKPAVWGCGDYGDFGERGENDNAPPAAPLPAFDWPDGVDYWLTKHATRLAGVLNMGGTYRWCSDGSLDMRRADGDAVVFGPHTIAALRVAGLLPDGLD